MTRILLFTIGVVCLTALLFVNTGECKNVVKRDIETVAWNDFMGLLCHHVYLNAPAYLCNTNTNTTTTTTTTVAPTTTVVPTTTVALTTTPVEQETTTEQDSDEEATTTTELTGSALERAHWCQFKNGSYAALGQTFIYNKCSLCQCTTAHTFRCTNLQCLAAYCIDGSSPYVQQGQCCQQCGYEHVSNSSSCLVSGILFPHGTLLSQTTNNIQCWCQLGSVECRKSASTTSSLDLWGSGTAVYVVVVIVIAIVLFGLLLCCGGALVFYYYYNRSQQMSQEAYAQYYTNAGWQPMSDDGQVVVDEKQAEAEAQQYAEYPVEKASDFIPPPYALYNGSVVNQENHNEQRST